MAKEYVEQRSGGYYVAGTRVSLDSIVECFSEGLSPETILGAFETLNLAQGFGAIAYYLENQSAIDAYAKSSDSRQCGGIPDLFLRDFVNGLPWHAKASIPDIRIR